MRIALYANSLDLYRVFVTGKSCLVDRYINGAFEATQKNTIGAAFAAKKVPQFHRLSAHKHMILAIAAALDSQGTAK